METIEALLLKMAIRKAADEIVGLWWCGFYAPAKVDAVAAIIEKHLVEVQQ